MTFVSIISFISSFIGVIGFVCWDNGIQFPVLTPFGTFLGEFWFHDYGRYGKLKYGESPSDGPPMVLTKTDGGEIPFPYPFQGGNQLESITYSETVNATQEYTPVDGMYGVTSTKPSVFDKSSIYIPGAISKSDYIAKRLLGTWATWNDVQYQGTGKIKGGQNLLYNTNTFKDGDPFAASRIGPNKQNDDRWSDAPKYTSSVPGQMLQVPMTSTGVGTWNQDEYAEIFMSTPNYTGMEYNDTAVDYYTSKESDYCSAPRPNDYMYDMNGNAITGTSIATYPSETNTDYTGDISILPVYADGQYDGTFKVTGSGENKYMMGWGTPSEDINTGGDPRKIIPTIQSDYITTMLSQPNPISKFDSRRKKDE